ncbi:MAG: hypothetical protein IPK93_06115 [Solirubrobacterales bacterium]|nr:hypothetical protein [Solirubrobacterales bacterium]
MNFSFQMTNAATAFLSTAPSGVRWRMRNSMTGAVTGTTENGMSFSVTFPDRGHWVIEGRPWGSPLLGGDAQRNEWMYVGEVDVNGPPTATLAATRPVVDGTTSIDATDVTDPDSGQGGLIQDVMWDLDFNATNGVGASRTKRSAHITEGPPDPASTARPSTPPGSRPVGTRSA